MMKNILAGIAIYSVFIGNVIATNFTGVIVCNETPEALIITCNGNSAPPVPSHICLPASWKDMATLPIFFGGTKQNPITHFICTWDAKNSGKQIMSTAMDISDNYTSGKVSQIVINPPYTAQTVPNPIPEEYLSSIYVALQKN